MGSNPTATASRNRRAGSIGNRPCGVFVSVLVSLRLVGYPSRFSGVACRASEDLLRQRVSTCPSAARDQSDRGVPPAGGSAALSDRTPTRRQHGSPVVLRSRTLLQQPLAQAAAVSSSRSESIAIRTFCRSHPLLGEWMYKAHPKEGLGRIQSSVRFCVCDVSDSLLMPTHMDAHIGLRGSPRLELLPSIGFAQEAYVGFRHSATLFFLVQVRIIGMVFAERLSG